MVAHWLLIRIDTPNDQEEPTTVVKYLRCHVLAGVRPLSSIPETDDVHRLTKEMRRYMGEYKKNGAEPFFIGSQDVWSCLFCMLNTKARPSSSEASIAKCRYPRALCVRNGLPLAMPELPFQTSSASR